MIDQSRNKMDENSAPMGESHVHRRQPRHQPASLAAPCVYISSATALANSYYLIGQRHLKHKTITIHFKFHNTTLTQSRIPNKSLIMLHSKKFHKISCYRCSKCTQAGNKSLTRLDLYKCS